MWSPTLAKNEPGPLGCWSENAHKMLEQTFLRLTLKTNPLTQKVVDVIPNFIFHPQNKWLSQVLPIRPWKCSIPWQGCKLYAESRSQIVPRLTIKVGWFLALLKHVSNRLASTTGGHGNIRALQRESCLAAHAHTPKKKSLEVRATRYLHLVKSHLGLPKIEESPSNRYSTSSKYILLYFIQL